MGSTREIHRLEGRPAGHDGPAFAPAQGLGRRALTLEVGLLKGKITGRSHVLGHLPHDRLAESAGLRRRADQHGGLHAADDFQQVERPAQRRIRQRPWPPHPGRTAPSANRWMGRPRCSSPWLSTRACAARIAARAAGCSPLSSRMAIAVRLAMPTLPAARPHKRSAAALSRCPVIRSAPRIPATADRRRALDVVVEAEDAVPVTL